MDFGSTAGVLDASESVGSDSQIYAYVPAGSGTVPVTVSSPGGTSSPVNIEFATQPVVTGVSPAYGAVTPQGGSYEPNGETVTITGQNFGTLQISGGSLIGAFPDPNLEVAFSIGSGSSEQLLGAASGQELQYPIPDSTTYTYPSNDPEAGYWQTTCYVPSCYQACTADVRLQTSPAGVVPELAEAGQSPGNWSATTTADLFTYEDAPVVQSVSPTAGPAAGGEPVTICGSNFGGASAVNFGSQTVDIDPNNLTLLTPATYNSAGVQASPSQWEITCAAPAGTRGTTVDVTVTAYGATSRAANAAVGRAPQPLGRPRCLYVAGTALGQYRQLPESAFYEFHFRDSIVSGLGALGRRHRAVDLGHEPGKRNSR